MSVPASSTGSVARLRRSPLPSPVGVRIRGLLQIRDRLVDATRVAAEGAVDESGRVVEIGCAWQKIGVLPHRVARVGTDRLGHPLPQRRRLPQLAGPQLEADEGGERLLGGPAGGTASAQRLAQRLRARQPVAERRRDDGLHPALDEREQRLETFQRDDLFRAWSSARTCPG